MASVAPQGVATGGERRSSPIMEILVVVLVFVAGFLVAWFSKSCASSCSPAPQCPTCPTWTGSNAQQQLNSVVSTQFPNFNVANYSLPPPGVVSGAVTELAQMIPSIPPNLAGAQSALEARMATPFAISLLSGNNNFRGLA